MDTPMVRLLLGKTLDTMSMVAGSEMAVQDTNNTAPKITACQLGMVMTTT